MHVLKRILSALLFLAGLLGLLAAASFLVIPKNNTEEAGMENVSANGILGEPENTIDVLVLGDSESYSSVSPMLIWRDTGYTAYVCGTASQKLSYSYAMLDKVLRTQKPKLVILETLAIYRTISAGDVIMDGVGKYLPILRYHNRWKSLTAEDFTSTPQANWQHDTKGHWTNRDIMSASTDAYMVQSDQKAEIDAINKEYVKKIKELCEENGARLVFLSTPSPVNWNYDRHNGIQALAEELGCTYLDLNLMNDKLKIDWTQDTRDKGDHLNHFGAVKVSRFLSEYLKTTGILKDHRGDPDFARWDADLKKYEADLPDSKEIIS